MAQKQNCSIARTNAFIAPNGNDCEQVRICQVIHELLTRVRGGSGFRDVRRLTAEKRGTG